MKKSKFLVFASLLLVLVGCSIEQRQDPLIVQGIDGKDGKDGKDGFTPSFEQIPVGGGTTVIVYVDSNGNLSYTEGELILTKFFVSNGTDGQDGQDGADGLTGPRGPRGPKGDTGDQGEEGPAGPKGEDGSNGVNAYQIRSTNITLENGDLEITFYLDIDGSEDFTEGDQIVNVFVIPRGADGNDGQNGTNGTNGTTPVITYVVINAGDVYNETYYEYGGILVIITVGDNVTTFIINNGADGQDGQDGQDGADGVCVCEVYPEDCDDDKDKDKVALCHKQEKDKKNGNGNGEDDDYITIYVNQNAVAAHLAHGDIEGECDND